MMKRILFALMIFLVLISFVRAEDTKPTTYTLPAYFSPSYGQDPTLIMPWQDEYCNKTGMDFLVETLPDACENVPVRSDLLEEQDVPVFCRLTGVKINPLIQVPYIKSVEVTIDNASKEVYDATFFPAQTAFSYYASSQGAANNLTGYPSLNNLGSLMIRLRAQPVESKMPDNVSLNLSARITYDVAKTFGVYENSFVLRKMTDAEWQQEYTKYSFWNGKGYIRLLGLEGTSRAKIALYTNPNSAPIWQGTLSVGGDPSPEIKIPYYYCDAGPTIKLDKIDQPKAKARLIVNGNELVLTQNADLLDSGCKISAIEPSDFSFAGKVEISCMGTTYKLSLDEAQAELEVNGNSKMYSFGDEIKIDSKSWYLGYAGKTYDKSDEEVNTEDFAVVYSGQNSLGETTQISLKTRQKISTVLERIEQKLKSDEQSIGTLSDNMLSRKITEDTEGKKLIGVMNNIHILKTSSNENGLPKLKKVTGFVDSTYSTDVEKVFKDAIEQYRHIAYSYSQTKSAEGVYYGIWALRNAADLAGYFDKRVQQISLLINLIDKYSDSDDVDIQKEVENARRELSNMAGSGGNTNVIINTKNQGDYVVQLIAVERPGLEALKADIEVDNELQEVTVNDVIQNDWYVYSIDESSVQFKKEGGTDATSSITIANGNQDYLPDTQTKIKVMSTEVNLESTVTLIPFQTNRVTEANFSIQIGIDKRAIQLSPEKINKLIGTLNKTIDSLTAISNVLNKTTSIWEKACYVTGIGLWIKNFITGLNGESLARVQVMKKWENFCHSQDYRNKLSNEVYNQVKYMSVSTCYQLKENDINKDIDIYNNALQKTNDYINQIKKTNGVISKGGLLGLSQFTDENKFMEVAQATFPNDIKTIEINKEKPIETISARLQDLYNQGDMYRDKLKDMVLNLYELQECRDKLVQNPNLFSSSAICNSTEETLSATIKPFEEKLKGAGKTDLLSSSSPDIAQLKEGLESAYAYTTLGNVNQVERPVWKGNICGEEVSYTLGVTRQGETILVLSDTGDGRYKISKAYTFKNNNGVWEITKNSDGKSCFTITEFKETLGIEYSIIVPLDPKSCSNNKIKDPEIKFWDSGPYQGTIALMPVIRASGWYMATQSYTGLEGDLTSSKSNGDLNTFWVCNVGPDGKVDFDFNLGPQGDDAKCCTKVSLPVSKEIIIPPMQDTTGFIEKVKSCVATAKSEYSQGKKQISVPECGGPYSLGKPPASVPTLECEDFMSPTDCRIMFNVCDPVICPSSRCNFGGRYYTTNVVREGIIGSIFLCLPNFDDGRGTLVPICISGLNQGVYDFTNVLKAYRACLQENLASGKTVGICDEVQSLYICDFFWGQINPLLKYGIPQLTSAFQGGGEYSLFSETWQNSMKSLDYFTQAYAPEKIKAFKEQSTSQVQTEVCNKFISTVFPSPGKFLDELSTPEVYPNALASLYEVAQMGETPESHYKVHYLISGGSSGVFYTVFMKNPPAGGFYTVPDIYYIEGATGYLASGQIVDQTPDFLAPSGYKELCVRLNSEEKCDFGTVSWNFATEELQNIYLEQQSTTPITKASECESGKSSIIPVASLNLQNVLEQGISPELYKQGIERRCASQDPGASIGQTGRFAKVGYCDNQDIGCWVDLTTVNNTISDLQIRQDVINYSKETQKKLFEAMNLEGLETADETSSKLEPVLKSLTSIEEKLPIFQNELKTLEGKTQEEIDKGKDTIKKEINVQVDQLEQIETETKDIISKAYDADMKAKAEETLAKILDLKAKLEGKIEVWEQELIKSRKTCTSKKGTWKSICDPNTETPYTPVNELYDSTLSENKDKKCCVPHETTSAKIESQKFDVWPLTGNFYALDISSLNSQQLPNNYITLLPPFNIKKEVVSIGAGVVVKKDNPVQKILGFIGEGSPGSVTIQYAENLFVIYSNLAEVNVNVGEKVSANQIIGKTNPNPTKSVMPLTFYISSSVAKGYASYLPPTQELNGKIIPSMCFFTSDIVNKIKEINTNNIRGAMNKPSESIPIGIIGEIKFQTEEEKNTYLQKELDEFNSLFPSDAECQQIWSGVGELEVSKATLLDLVWPTNGGTITSYYLEQGGVSIPAGGYGKEESYWVQNGVTWHKWKISEFAKEVNGLVSNKAIAQGIITIAIAEQGSGEYIQFPETNTWGVMVASNSRADGFGWGSDIVQWLSPKGYFEEIEGQTQVSKKFVEFNSLDDGVRFMEHVWAGKTNGYSIQADDNGVEFAKAYIWEWYGRKTWTVDSTQFKDKSKDITQLWNTAGTYV